MRVSTGLAGADADPGSGKEAESQGNKQEFLVKDVPQGACSLNLSSVAPPGRKQLRVKKTKTHQKNRENCVIFCERHAATPHCTTIQAPRSIF